jgi:serine/threonine-protein kinase
VLLFQALAPDEDAAEPTQFILDDYFGRSLTVVTAELSEKGLLFTSIEEENASVPFGFVHRTDPAAGEVVLENQQIQVFYNPDPQLQNVPNVVGQNIDEATVTLESLGFDVGTITTDENSDLGEGTVLSTEPEAGTPVAQGTTVDITVAGRQNTVPVPGVVGQIEQVAVDTLEAPPFEFVVSVERVPSETIDEGFVISTSPSQGELVERGGNITVQVSSGAAPVAVPVVEGLTQGEATNRLRADGFNVETRFQDVPPGSANDGVVISQDPAAATRLDRGSTVTITVGRSTIAVTTLPPPTVPPSTSPPPSTTPPTTDAATTTSSSTTSSSTTTTTTSTTLLAPP